MAFGFVLKNCYQHVQTDFSLVQGPTEPKLLDFRMEISYMSKFFLRIAVPTVIFLGGLMVTSSLSFGKAEYTKKEKKACTFCHTSATSKELNDVGKCYAANNHSLDACAPKK
jgi:hypothetical protein